MASEPVGVIVIHGVGNKGAVFPVDTNELTFSKDMARQVRRKLGERGTAVAWREVSWSDILHHRRSAYLDDIRDKTSSDAARDFMMAALSDAAAYRKTADGPSSIYEQVHSRVEITIRDLEEDIGPNGQILILAHSLGGHVISNYIYDLQQFYARTGRGRFSSTLQNMRSVAGLMTFGCTIPVFLFAHRREDIRSIEYPGQDLAEDRQIKTWWQNFYDKQDIMAYPLGSAAPCYTQMVTARSLRDVPIHMGTPEVKGWDPISHGSYWDDAELITPVVHYINKMFG